MRKISAATTLALLLALILGSTVAYAAYHWCMDDPVLHITTPEGDTITVNVLILPDPDGTAGDDARINGDVRVKVYVPKNIDVVCEPGDGWDGYNETCEIKHKGSLKYDDDELEFEVKVKVPATEKFPVRVTIVIPGDSEIFEGRTNKWVKCEIELGD
jgi:hypothetical protein